MLRFVAVEWRRWCELLLLLLLYIPHSTSCCHRFVARTVPEWGWRAEDASVLHMVFGSGGAFASGGRKKRMSAGSWEGNAFKLVNKTRTTHGGCVRVSLVCGAAVPK